MLSSYRCLLEAFSSPEAIFEAWRQRSRRDHAGAGAFALPKPVSKTRFLALMPFRSP